MCAKIAEFGSKVRVGMERRDEFLLGDVLVIDAATEVLIAMPSIKNATPGVPDGEDRGL